MSATRTNHILRATGLKVRYRNGALGILDVTVEMFAGEIVALFGPNGAGKITTVRAISGFRSASTFCTSELLAEGYVDAN